MIRRRTAAPLLALTLCRPAATHAQALPSWSLRWAAPAGCPGPSSVRARVATLVGAGAQRGARVRWDVTVRADGTGFLAAVRAVNDGVVSAQNLSAPRCDELAETAALLLAWIVQPDGGAIPPAPAPSPPLSYPAPSVVRWGHVGLGVRVDVGLAPTAAAGPSLRLGLGGRRWSAHVDAAWLPAQEASTDARRGGRFEAWTVALSLCGRWGRGRWRAGPCAGIEAGAIHARGYGISDPVEAVEPWVAARAGATVDVALFGPVHLVAAVVARVPLRRAEFVLENVGRVHQPWALGVLGDVGVDVHF